MSRRAAAVTTIDERFTIRAAPNAQRSFLSDVRHGLTSPSKQLQPRYFYDALGSALFAAISELPEYYVTRAENEIVQASAGEMARRFGSVDRLIELGSGNARKTQRLIAAILARQSELLFEPIDVDPGVLESSGRELLATFPTLNMEAICGDYRDVAPNLSAASTRTVVLFLGSSIGNLDAVASTALLRDIRRSLNPGDTLLLGVDLKKSKAILEPAYNDALGVTAAFNLNILARINRELDGHFDLGTFSHRAFYNEREGRIEMHLVSRRRQSVSIGALDLQVQFDDGESIHTENSYKYDVAEVQALASASGFRIENRWTDSRSWFADLLMVARM